MFPLRAFLVLVAGLMVGFDVPPGPTEWSLGQNNPDPFCGVGGGGTAIEFAVPVTAHVNVDVWRPDMSSVARHLTDGMLSPGYFTVVWDGRDSLGAFVPNGSYPYRLTATNEERTRLLFQDTKVARIECLTSVESSTWGRVKALYR